MSSSPLIQIILLRRNNNVFTLAISKGLLLVSRCDRVLASCPGRQSATMTTNSEKPRIAGELRLRVTSSDDPASFENGSGLLRIDGQPWSRPLCVLPKQYLSLYEKLREDRLVPDDLDAVLSTLPNKKLHYRLIH